jgi:Leucine-rich repeat (LRR) protein
MTQQTFVLQLNQVGARQIDSKLQSFASVEFLELCDNKLKFFPTQIFQMSSLKGLKLDNNYLKKVPSIGAGQ